MSWQTDTISGTRGGGAFQPATFGYIGQPANGHRSLATLYDASVDIAVSPRVSIIGYYGYAEGGSVAAVNYLNWSIIT